MRPRLFGSLTALISFALAAAAMPFVPADDDAPPGLLVALKGHKEPVYAVAFSPDGKFLVTGAGDPSAKVWDAASGKELKTFAGNTGHKGLVLAVAVSPDGTKFATGGADNLAMVWDFPSSAAVREFTLAGAARSLAVSPDGKRIAGGDKDGKIRVWSDDGKQQFEFSGHTGAVTSLAIGPNNQPLLSAGADSTLRAWSLAEGRTYASFAPHPGSVSGVAFSPNGNSVYTSGDDGTLRFWATPTAGSRQVGFADAVAALALSPDGSQFVAGAGKAVRLANLANGATVRDFASPEPVTAAAVSGGGALVAAGAGGKAMLWQSKDGLPLMEQPAHAGGVTGLAFSPNGAQLASVGKDGWFRLFAVPPAPARVISHPDAVRAAVLSPDGKRLATAGADKTIRLFKLDNLKSPERQLTGQPAAVGAVALSPDGKSLATGGDDGALRFWGLEKGEPAGIVGGHAGPITSVVWAGDRVLTSSSDGGVKAWQVPGAAGKMTFAHAGAVTCLAQSPDGARLLTGCDDKQVRLWNLATGQLERSWTGPALAVVRVAFSPKGDRVAAGSADKALFVWEFAGNKLLKKIDLPGAVNSLALTGDGKSAVVGLSDGSLRLFDVDSGKELRLLASGKSAVTTTGELFLTSSADGKVTLDSLAGKPPAKTWEFGAAAKLVALSRDGAKAAVAGDKLVKVFALPAAKVEATITLPAEVRDVSFSPDGKKLLVACSDNRARLFDAEGRLEEYFAHDGAVNATTFTSDGKRVLTASADKTARVATPSLIWHGRHDGAARALIFNPRDGRVLSGGEDGLVRLWNFADGKPVSTIRAHTGAVNSLSLNANGGRLVSVGADKTARVWDRTRPPVEKPIVSIDLPAVPISVSVTPDGLRIAAGVEIDGKERVVVYDAVSGRPLVTLGDDGLMPARGLSFLDGRTLLAAGGDRTARLVDVNVLGAWEAHPGGCVGVAFHDNGMQAVTAGADKSAKLWAVASGKLQRSFPMPAAADAVTLSKGGLQLAATAGKALRLWNVGDAKELLALEMPSAARSVSLNGDRTRLATAHDDGKARVWEIALKLEQQAFLHTGAVTGVHFHPATPTQMLSSGVDKSVAVHTLSSARTVVLGAPQRGLVVTSNSTHVVAAGADGKVRLVNPNSGNVDRVLDAVKEVLSVAVSRTVQLVAAGCSDKKVRLFQFNDGKLVMEFTAPAEPTALAFATDNLSLLATGRDGSVTVYDVAGYNPGQPTPTDFGKVTQAYQHGGDAVAVALPAAGATFYTAGGSSVKAWKVASAAPLRTFGHPNTVNAIAFDKAGKHLATGAGDGFVRLYDPDKGTVLRQINAHPLPNNQGAVYGVAFSPDGSLVASASKDGSLKLFNVANGSPVRELRAFKEKDFPKGHTDAVLCVAFSPDGKQLASAGADRIVKVWNVADGSVVREMSGHPGWVYAVVWADGGKAILSAGAAPRLRGHLAVWDVSTGKPTWSKEMGVGTIYSLAVSPDGQRLALGTGGSVRAERDLNVGWVVKMPK